MAVTAATAAVRIVNTPVQDTPTQVVAADTHPYSIVDPSLSSFTEWTIVSASLSPAKSSQSTV